jgi:two-component system CheB/CheR fusion protein
MTDPRESSSAAAPAAPPSLPFPVVGIGASAGGLQASLRMFENMPANTGMAFVVILHLSPRHQSRADEVLRKATRMPVLQVAEPVHIEPGHVYVIAPNMQLSMEGDMLKVGPLERSQPAHVAIDTFFRSLAEAQRERAIALVLSGTGGDGAVGIARVKEKGGVILVQSPGDAEHDGMPLSAIATGLADFILPAAEMPQKLIDIWRNARSMELPQAGPDGPWVARALAPAESAGAEDALQRVVGLLRIHTGHDFRNYKRATVLRRIERRMQVRSVRSLPEYLRLMEADPNEHRLLLNDLLIGVTNFFRDRDAFEALERDVLPLLFRDRKASDEVRAWVPGCATGEEAYSVAMLMAEQAALAKHGPAYQVFASDIDERAITIARAGLYPLSIVTDVAPPRLREHFVREDQRYRIRKAVRERVLFALHNLLRDPPFSNIDLVSCRNLLIYLNREVQTQLLETFHFALKPGGYLFLGSSESAEVADELFQPVDRAHRIYRAATAVRSLPRRSPHAAGAALRALALQPAVAGAHPLTIAEVHQRALAQLAPPSVVIDADHNILHMSERAGQYMRVVGGEPSRDILAMVLPELRIELRSALYQVQHSGGSVEGRQVSMIRNGKPSVISITARPFHDDVARADYLLVMFSEVERSLDMDLQERLARSDDAVLTQLEAELQRKKQQLLETVEHAEISTEELRAANEELQAINEELRSATEELETSKEELQSTNEELVTVNYELKLKVDETGKANDDLNNLIASTDIATVFVDRGLRIKRFTPRAADIFSIIPSDVGRSLLDLTHRLDYAQLADDVMAAFGSLRLVEREVRSHDGRYYVARLLPYRTTEDRIDGAVMTFFDITSLREVERRLNDGEAWLRQVAENTRDYAIFTMDENGVATSWNLGAERMFGYAEAEVLGRRLDFLYPPDGQGEGVLEGEMRGAREAGQVESERWLQRKDGSRFVCGGVTTRLSSVGVAGYGKIARDMTERVRHEAEREQALSSEQLGRSHAESASALKDEFLAIMAHELRHPLNLININVELMARAQEVRQSAMLARQAHMIRNAVLAQARIIDDLLDMSRMRTGKLSLSMAPVGLGPLVGAAVEAVRTDPGGGTLHIAVTGDADDMEVMADSVRLEQVVMNLLSNAVKFTPPGGTITVTLAREGEEARLDVVDTGQGIAPEALPRVFEMFGQPHSVTTRSKGGLGIGLALVREIVAQHGGRVEAASSGIGQGARFTVRLPLLEHRPRAQPREADGLEAGIEGVRVLLVDDVEEVVTVTKTLLEMVGAQVEVATSAREGLALARQQDFDVLVSDISMPEMDGFQFLRELRQEPRAARIPAIAISGLGRDKDVAMAREAGFAAHLGKPMSVERLAGIIRELLSPRPRPSQPGRRRAQRSAAGA